MIGIIILASGFSRRMGEPKLLLKWQDTSILRTVAETALRTEGTRIKIVLNPLIPRLSSEIEDLPVTTVWNHDENKFMSTSLRAGLELLENDITAVLVLLADQPLMTEDIINQVLSEYRESKTKIVQAAFKGRPGHPVLFDRSLFPELLLVTGDQGAKEIIEKYKDERQFVHFDMPPIKDIDTKADYLDLIQSEATYISENNV